MLPGRDGHHVCRDLRARWGLPVLMLTALGDEDARVAGLEAGADDYVCKPFSPRELLLRIRSLLRRTTSANASLSELLRDGDLSLHLGRREALVGQRVLPLTTREHDLLQFLLQHPGVNCTRQELLERVWGWQHGDLSTVTVHVRRLREKNRGRCGQAAAAVDRLRRRLPARVHRSTMTALLPVASAVALSSMLAVALLGSSFCTRCAAGRSRPC